MRGRLVLTGLLLFGTVAWPCGDKLLLVMGSQFSQIKPFRPAAILVYPGQLASAALIRSFASQPAFKKAGHRMQLVEDSAGFDDALKAGKYDVVVADVASAGELSQQVSAASSKPVLLPVAFKASKEEQYAASKKYHCLLRGPSSNQNYLEAIDQAMEWKLKGATR
jgi:hypothetical protein